MANQKISDLKTLNSSTMSSEDIIPIVDVSANSSPSGELKKISVSQLVQGLSLQSADTVREIAETAAGNAVVEVTNTAITSLSGSFAQRIEYISASFSSGNDTVSEAYVEIVNTAIANATGSLASRIETVSSSFTTAISNANASVINSSLALTNASQSLAQRMTQISSSFITLNSSANATINQLSAALTTASQSLATQVNSLQTQITETGGLIATADYSVITTVVSNATASLTSRIDTLSSSFSQASSSTAASVSGFSSTLTTASQSLASSINTLVATANNQSISINNINTVTASVNGVLHANWGVNIDANGRVVGSVKLDGSAESSSFVVKADRFLVASGNIAPINLLDIKDGNIVFGADVASDNFSSGASGWKVSKNGNAEFKNVTVRDGIYINSIPNPFIDPPSGIVYSNQALTASLYTGSGTAARYTTDGSTPLSSSAVWPVGGLIINSSTMVRAVCYSGSVRSNEATATYQYIPAQLLSTTGNTTVIYDTIANAPTYVTSSAFPYQSPDRYPMSANLGYNITCASPNTTIQMTYSGIQLTRGTGSYILGFDGSSGSYIHIDFNNPITSTTPYSTPPGYEANTTSNIVTGSTGTSALAFNVNSFQPGSFNGIGKLYTGTDQLSPGVYIGTASINQALAANWNYRITGGFFVALATYPTGSSATIFIQNVFST